MLPQYEFKFIWYQCVECGHIWFGPVLDVSLDCPLDGAPLLVFPGAAEQRVHLTDGGLRVLDNDSQPPAIGK